MVCIFRYNLCNRKDLEVENERRYCKGKQDYLCPIYEELSLQLKMFLDANNKILDERIIVVTPTVTPTNIPVTPTKNSYSHKKVLDLDVDKAKKLDDSTFIVDYKIDSLEEFMN